MTQLILLERDWAHLGTPEWFTVDQTIQDALLQQTVKMEISSISISSPAYQYLHCDKQQLGKHDMQEIYRNMQHQIQEF